MPVRFKVKNGLGMFHCPGCGRAHRVPVNGSLQAWSWNGSQEAPTLQPSLYFNCMDPASRCHSFVTDGRIMFLTDCHHKLAGRTVDIPEWS